MDILTTAELRGLMKQQQGPCVSVYLPTHISGTDGQQNPIRLKNLLRDAEQKLTERGMRSAEARSLLEPARKLISDEMFWREQSEGMAVFLAPDVFRYYRLSRSFEETVTVGERFCVKPLLPLVSGDGHFFVLALSRNRPRLLRGTKFAMEEVEVPEMPGSLAEALNYDEPQASSQSHTAQPAARRKQSLAFHGQGGAPDAAKDEVEQYFRLVESAIRPVLRKEKAPLVLATTDSNLAIFRKLTSYSNVADEAVTGNPDRLSPAELHKKVWPVAERFLTQEQAEAMAQFRQLAGTGRASDDPRSVVAAAHEGRIDKLLLDPTASLWGRYQPAENTVEINPTPQNGDEDLVDLTAYLTLKQRGVVHSVETGAMPTESPLAAVFRYS